MIKLVGIGVLFGGLALSALVSGCSAEVESAPDAQHRLADTGGDCGDFDGNGTLEYADWEGVCTGTLPASSSAQELVRRDFDQDGDFDADDCEAFWQWWLEKGYSGASPPCAAP